MVQHTAILTIADQ